MTEHSEEIAVPPPIVNQVSYSTLDCPFARCGWGTKYLGGVQEDIANRIYREHVEAEHSGSDADG